MSFLPPGLIPALAVMATIGEALFGVLILAGLFTRAAAIGSSLLSFCFAVAMAISFGIDSPLGYSVFTLSAGSLLLATLPQYAWSLDAVLERKAINKRLVNNNATSSPADDSNYHFSSILKNQSTTKEIKYENYIK
jgi:hypothetical protein